MSERVYKIHIDGGDRVRELPSVTTIVRQMHSYALERYKLRLAVEITRSSPHDWSPDRIVSACNEEGGWAAKAGTRQHELADMVHGAAVEPVSPAENSMLAIIRRCFDSFDLEVLAREAAVASLHHGWAGRLDRVVRLRQPLVAGEVTLPAGLVCVLDIKSGREVQPEVALQLKAYAAADTWLDKEGSSFTTAPLPDWWHEVSQEWGLVAHIRLDGTYKLVPVRLEGQIDGQRWPIDMLQKCKAIWEWARYERPHLLLPAAEPALSAEQVAEIFHPDTEVVDEMEQYTTKLWAWLRTVSRHIKAESDEAYALLPARWPAGVASFKQVSNGTAPLPTLHQMALVEALMAEAMKRHTVRFPFDTDRPLPPRGAGFDAVPEAVITLDSPHPLDVEALRVDWEQLHTMLWPKKRVPALPSIATRRTLHQYQAQLAAFRETHAEKLGASV